MMISDTLRSTAQRFASASQASHSTTNTTVLLAFVSVIFGGIMATRITRGITKPVHKLVGAPGGVARGDLSQRIETEAKDEIGKLLGPFNQMVDDLKRLEEAREHEVAERKRNEAELQGCLVPADGRDGG